MCKYTVKFVGGNRHKNNGSISRKKKNALLECHIVLYSIHITIKIGGKSP